MYPYHDPNQEVPMYPIRTLITEVQVYPNPGINRNVPIHSYS